MSLDAFVRCTCIRDGRAKPHPLGKRFMLDETGSPSRQGHPCPHEGEARGRWGQESCQPAGHLVSQRLGNITRAQHARVFLRGLQGEPGAQLPILLKKVVDDGTHTGDWVPLKESPARLREVAPVRPALPRTNQSCSDCTESFPRMNAEFVIVMQPMRHPRRQPAGDVKSRY